MKKILIVLLGILLLPIYTYTKDLTGRDIAKLVDAANQSKKGLVIKGTMILKYLKSKNIEQRKYCMLSTKVNNLKRTLFRFESSSYKGTTFLTIEKPGKKKIQYLYLKSIGSPRQVESSDKENNFIDTDIANEDLGGININDYNYKRLPDRKIGDTACYVIERYPKSKSSKYKKHTVIIDKKKLVPIAVKAYSKEGRLVKTIRSSNIRKIGNNIFYPFETIITDIQKKHQTIVKIESAKEKTVNRGYFNKNRMNRRWNEE